MDMELKRIIRSDYEGWDSLLQYYQNAPTNNRYQVVKEGVAKVIGLRFDPRFF